MPPERSGSLADAIRRATARLGETSETPRLDAELLMAHVLGTTREAMVLNGLHKPPPPFVLSAVEGQAQRPASGARPSTATSANGGFWSLVERRAAGEPVAYITGTRAFWDIELAVSPAVLIPRPDSETLIEAAIGHFAGTPGPATILDLGTGSGALLLAALRVWPAAAGVGIDRSAAALAVAADNAARHGLADRARLIEGGWAGTGAAFDLVLCNPPYIATNEPLPRDVVAHEPHGALFAGVEGLDDYRTLLPLLPSQLVAGGVACIEIGATQGGAVSAIAIGCGLAASLRRDLAGRDRCLAATHPDTYIPLGFPR